MFSVDKYKRNKKEVIEYQGSVTKGNNEFIDNIPAGIYNFELKPVGMFGTIPLFKKDDLPDNVVPLESDFYKSLENRVVDHFGKRISGIYSDLNIKNSLGVLLYGPPGTGKTYYCYYLINKLVKNNNAVCIRLSTEFDFEMLQAVIDTARGTDPDRMIILLFDEFERYIGSMNYDNKLIVSSNFYRILEFLDGYATMNNIMYLCTTNHMAAFPNSLTERPSRFKICEEIKYIPIEVAMTLVKQMIPKKYYDLIDISKLGYIIGENPIKIDQIKHVALDIITQKCSIEEAIKRVCKFNVKEEKKEALDSLDKD